MRITVTLDPDVAFHIRQRLESSSATRKEVVNDALRRGFAIPLIGDN